MFAEFQLRLCFALRLRVFQSILQEFYLNYLARWPDHCHIAKCPNVSAMSYIIILASRACLCKHQMLQQYLYMRSWVYVVYRTLLREKRMGYMNNYMRKAMRRDKDRKSVVPLKMPITPDDLEYD